MRIRVRQDSEVSPLAKRAGEHWTVRIASTLRGKRVSNPLTVGDSPAGTYAIYDHYGDESQSLIDLIKSAQDAEGALLGLAERDGDIEELLRLCGYQPFTVDGSPRLFAANYALPEEEWLHKIGELNPEQPQKFLRLSSLDRITPDLIPGSAELIKADSEEDQDEHYILGIVLEPDEVDSQGDTITASVIRQAAHTYMEDFGNVGLQHQTFVNGKIKILESYICPCDATIGGQLVKAGTWLMGFRVLDKSIWEAVKEGLLTGLSIGGSGIRVPA